MLANCSLTQCDSVCLQDCTQDIRFMPICKDSSPVRINLEFPQIWSCRTLNSWDRIVELRTSEQHEFTKAWLFQFSFVDVAKQCYHGHYCACQDARPALTEENRKKKEVNGWNGEAVYRGEKFHFCWIVAMWVVEFLQTWCVSKGTLEKNTAIHAFIAPGSVIGQDKIRRIVSLPTVWYHFYRRSKWTNFIFFRQLPKT